MSGGRSTVGKLHTCIVEDSHRGRLDTRSTSTTARVRPKRSTIFLARTSDFEIDPALRTNYFLTFNPRGYLKRVRAGHAVYSFDSFILIVN